MPLDLHQIDKSWTLFLDRDGVINHEANGDYIRNPAGFVFYDQAVENILLFNQLFFKVIVVTNQRGIAKGLMTEADLQDIHQAMLDTLAASGAGIDAIFYCLGDISSPCRKPNPGMAFEAKAAFPSIDFNKSIMVGNNLSDMNFARNVGMSTVFVRTTSPDIILPNPVIDLDFINLNGFAEALKITEL